ncbi:MAG: YihY/virulence factor BrkB family protein [Saprospiraceae bacterium]
MRSTVSDYVRQTVRYFTEHPWWMRLVEWSKTHSFPGLKRIPLYNLAGFIQQELKNDALITRANSMAYSFFLSIFPTIIVLFSVLAYTPVYESFEKELFDSIQEIMPGNAGQMVFDFIEDVATRPRGGLLSFGFFLAIWFASNGMMSMMRGLEKDHHAVFRRRSLVEKRLMAIQLTFLLSLILVASVVVGILGNLILDKIFSYFHVDVITRFTFFAFRWIVLLLLVYTTFSLIYRYGAPTYKQLSFINPGAVVGSGLSLLTSAGFSFYVDNFGNFNKLYGSIGTLIVLMLWIQLNCVILLMGFEINAGIVVLRERRRTELVGINGI